MRVNKDGYRGRRTYLDTPTAWQGFPAGFRRVSTQHVAGNDEQVGRHHTGHYVAAEGSGSSPGTAGQPEDAFQERDQALDTGPEVPKPLVDPGAPGHLRDLKASFPGETDVLDSQSFGCRQIVSGRKPTSEARLTGKTTIETRLPFQHGDRPRGVGRVPFLDHAVGDQSRGPCTQEDC